MLKFVWIVFNLFKDVTEQSSYLMDFVKNNAGFTGDSITNTHTTCIKNYKKLDLSILGAVSIRYGFCEPSAVSV